MIDDERHQAERIANAWLDFQMNPLTQMVPGDPDCDACVLARQYLRALDRFRAAVLAIRPAEEVDTMGWTTSGRGGGRVGPR
jgi:hypothetical protein